MSIEMQDAYTKDMTVMKEDGTYEYVDSPSTEDSNIIEAAEETTVTNIDEL